MSEGDYRVVYDPELDPKRKYKLQKSFYSPVNAIVKADPRLIMGKPMNGKAHNKKYYPVLFEFDEFSTIKSTNSILITTSSKMQDNELLSVIQGIGKLESFMFAKNCRGNLLMSVTFGHFSAVREAVLKWNNTILLEHYISVELDVDCNFHIKRIGQKFHDEKINPKDLKKKEKRFKREPPEPRKKEEKELIKEARAERYRPDVGKTYERRDTSRINKVMVKTKERSFSILEMIQEEIVQIVSRDYHNRVILGMISDALAKVQIQLPLVDESVMSRKSLPVVSGDAKIKRMLPTFKKIKNLEPIQNASAKLIKKSYKLLSKKKRFYMESDADDSSDSDSDSDSDESSDEEDETGVLEENVDVKEEDIMELDIEPIEVGVKAEPDFIEKSPNKKGKVKKAVNPKKLVKRQIKEQFVYQKPVRVPFDFTQYDGERVVENFSTTALIPDNGYQDIESLDISSMNLKEMGYDSEDERIIHSLFLQEVDRRKALCAKRMDLFDEDGQRRHLTGSARSEGYYAITSAQKKLHARAVSQKNRDITISPSKALAPANIPTEIRISSSRASRFTQRQLVPAQDIKKQIVPIDSAESLQYKQMKNRKRRLKFAKSDIHDWGLFAMEKIEANDMIIEYIGEKIRLKIADLREIEYEKQGIGSSYLFRVDEDIVIDATKIGNLARFINHCCEVINLQ